jgi:hypothetical protein
MSYQESPETGFIDVGEWQVAFDLRTGQALKEPAMEHKALPAIMRRLPFPGDLSTRSASWVTDLALEMNRLYNPSLMLLIHAGISFKTMYGEASAFATELERVHAEIERFIASSGLDCIILGLGNLVRVERFVDLSSLDGLGLGSGFPSSYAGVYRPSSRDMDYLRGSNEVIRTVGREDFRALFGGSDDFYERFPDYFLELADGYTIKGFGIPARQPSHMPRKDDSLPLATSGESPEHLSSITDLKNYLNRATRAGKRMALILVEGLGTKGFPWRYRAIDNTLDWFRYPLGDAQYLALSSGKHMTEHGHPPCLRYYMEDDLYPYSGIFNELPSGLIGQEVAGLSIAVGNRSIYTHACLGADITIECFARTLYNYGTLAVLRRSDPARDTGKPGAKGGERYAS